MKGIVSILNQKGGVGKSTTSHALGAGLAKQGNRVLCIDLDPQGNLSYIAGATTAGPGIYEVLTGKIKAPEAVQSDGTLSIMASSPALSGADAAFAESGKEYRLKKALAPIHGDYDFIVMDTPPALGILTINALTASTGCIIAAQADVLSLQGISQLYGTLEAVRSVSNPSLRVYGILLTRFNARAIISRESAQMIDRTAEQLHTKLYDVRIRECTALKECQATRQNIFDYAPRSNAAQDYQALIDEFLGVLNHDQEREDLCGQPKPSHAVSKSCASGAVSTNARTGNTATA